MRSSWTRAGSWSNWRVEAGSEEALANQIRGQRVDEARQSFGSTIGEIDWAHDFCFTMPERSAGHNG